MVGLLSLTLSPGLYAGPSLTAPALFTYSRLRPRRLAPFSGSFHFTEVDPSALHISVQEFVGVPIFLFVMSSDPEGFSPPFHVSGSREGNRIVLCP